jgi:hypothetical protein
VLQHVRLLLPQRTGEAFRHMSSLGPAAARHAFAAHASVASPEHGLDRG